MDSLTMMMLAAGIGKVLSGGLQTGIGLSQRNKAERKRDRLLENQPQYGVPSSIEDLSSLYEDYLAQAKKTEGFPGQQKMQQQLQQQTSSRLRDVTQTARTSPQAQGGVIDLLSKEMDALEQLEIQGARYAAERQLQATQMYGQSLGQQARYEDQAWRYNEWMPWRTQLAEQQARYRGGQRTFEAGMGNLVGGASQTAMTGLQAGWFGGGDDMLSNEDYINQTPQYNYQGDYNPYGNTGSFG